MPKDHSDANRRRIPFLSAFFSLLLAALTVDLSAAPPVVSNIRAAQRPGTHLVDIYYNVSDADGSGPLTIYVVVSDNGGASYGVPVFTLTGAVGPGVTTGNDRHIVWNAGTDWPGRFTSQCRVKITADDGTAPPAPAGMVYIPAGVFQMGDTFLEWSTAELPVHNVYVSAFFMDKFEVFREQWLDVYTWAVGHGYSIVNSGSYKAAGHPVHSINWYDAVKWCNARSQKEGLIPCYYTDATQTSVYTNALTPSLNNDCVKWTANGYRLPTEAEWEKAARGGQGGKRFPWGDSITHSQANYYSSASYSYDISPTRGTHPTYTTGSQPYTSPVGSFAPNGYGLHDMAGNLLEWCWDWFQGTWYGQVGATADNSRGPGTAQTIRVLRGGSWGVGAISLRCAIRDNYGYYFTPSSADVVAGFRCVRGL